MRNMVQNMVLQKIKSMTVEDLLEYSKVYNIPITRSQAKKIIGFIKTTDLNIFNEKDRLKFLKKIAKITDQQTAKKVYRLFQQVTKEYGLEGLFN